MTKKVHNTSFNLRYSSRDENHNTIRDISFDFENPDTEELAENINTWLTAIGHSLVISQK
jgi:hypothetical protein